MTHTTTTDSPTSYGMLAEYSTPEALEHAAEKARGAGITAMEAYTPFPMEGLLETLGKKRTKLPLLILMMGLTGCALGVFLQWYTAATEFPIQIGPYYLAGYQLNIGGRPMFSLPNFIPVIFELTILFSAFTAVFGMISLNRLPEPYHPLFEVPAFKRASQDRFFLAIEASDPKYDEAETKSMLESTNPDSIEVVPL